MLRLALAQINPVVGDLARNSQKILAVINQAKAQRADCVIFPELALTGYPPEDLLCKEHFIIENKKILVGLAQKVRDISAIVGFVDYDAQKRIYNAAAYIADGKIKYIYHKQELPNYGVFDEKRYFTVGKGSKNIRIQKMNVGINICEDIWIDSAVYKKQVRGGAKVLINISSSPFDEGKLETRFTLLKKRAKETKTHVVYVNLVGGQDELVFDGGSMVIDPEGQLVSMAKAFEEDLLVVEIGSGSNLKERKNRDLSKNLLTRTERVLSALVLGTSDYITKNGFKKVLIGLSGGIDSALVAAIAVEAIGKENVIGVTMPSRFSSEGTKSDAKQVAHNLGIACMEIPIEDTFKSYIKTLDLAFTGTMPGLAEENIQARIRGNILMALSNKFGWLVLTTGNKSEVAVGYCTLYGDMSGGYAVIKDVSKTRVYELAVLINAHKGDIIPQSTIDRPPTAELRENQKDQDSLPPYDLLDKILEGYVERHESIKKLSKRFPQETVEKVVKLVDQNEYKRRQAAPGIKISKRAFGKDWRLPITNKYKEV